MIPLSLEIFPRLTVSDVGRPPWDPIPPQSSDAAPPSCDVVIVGAGVTGLSAAIACAQAGRRVVVLERELGSGVTARSGGIVLGETVEGPHPEFNGCEDALRGWIEQSGVDCELRWQGCLELARNSGLSSMPIDWSDHGVVRFRGRVSGGVLNPAKLQMALLAAARAAGAAVVDHAIVSKVDQTHNRVHVVFGDQTISASAGIMAVDAMCWRRGFDPWPERVMTVSLQTVPLSGAELGALGLKRAEGFYTIDLPLLWGRVMDDSSLIVGRETDPFPRSPESRALRATVTRAGARLTDRVRRLHPVLSSVEIPTIWTGPLARTSAGHPTIARDPFVPTVLWAGGYGGQGIAQGFTLGRIAANRIISET